MVRIADIAKAAGVSTATVSRCLRKDPEKSLSTETGRKIYEAARALGYQDLPPSPMQDEILVVHKDSHFLDHVDNGYYFSIRSGIEEQAAKCGVSCRFVALSRLAEEQRSHTGTIVVGNYPPEELRSIVERTGTENLVFVGKINFFPECYDTVTYDVFEVVRIALDALEERHVGDFLFIDGKDVCQIPYGSQKVSCVRSYLASHPDMRMSEFIESDGYGSDAGYRTMSAWLSQEKALPSAVFAATDPLAIGVQKALAEHGKMVGRDISLVSINGDNAGRWLNPPLCSVDFNSRAMGNEAVRMVMANEKEPDHVHRCVYFSASMLSGGSIRQA
jgi:LacI family transcriptional regulator